MHIYLWIVLGMAFEGVLAIYILDRLREIHHLYIGVALQLVPWWPARIFGAILILDDTVQHFRQVFASPCDPMMPDWSPVHRAYVWIARRFLALVGR